MSRIVLNFIIAFLIRKSGLIRFMKFRKLYWECYSFYLVQRWTNTEDYVVLRRILKEYSVHSLLDFGAGGGRLLPLYVEMEIPEIILQDLSLNMKKICLSRFPCPPFKYIYTNNSMEEINSFYDIIIVNNVLSAISNQLEVENIVRDMMTKCKYLYIRENRDSDGLSWFNHSFAFIDKRRTISFGQDIIFIECNKFDD